MDTFQRTFRRPARLKHDVALRLEAAAVALGIEETLAALEEARAHGADPKSLAYFLPLLEERLFLREEGAERKTGWRFVRGSHAGTYVRDPDGVDPLPYGYDLKTHAPALDDYTTYEAQQ